MKTLCIIKTKDFQVRLPLSKYDWDKRCTVRTGCAGDIPLEIWHKKTSVKAYANMLDRIVIELNGTKMRKKLFKMISSVNGNPSVISNATIKGDNEFPLSKDIYIEIIK